VGVGEFTRAYRTGIGFCIQFWIWIVWLGAGIGAVLFTRRK
jgi:hypothetical protein